MRKLLQEKWAVRGIGHVVEPITTVEQLQLLRDNQYSSVHYFYLTAYLHAWSMRKAEEILEENREAKQNDPEE